tara:strand:+ start:3830 stop:4870 length:1041 start_codon:yes stop_codon:yes gene_type:complete
MEFVDGGVQAMQDIQELDETSGTTLVGFGKHRSRSYHWVLEHDEGYVDFVSSCKEPSPQLEKFQLWLRRREELFLPIKRRRKAERQFLQEQALELSRRAAQKKAELLKERMRTSRGDQLIGLSCVEGLFEQYILQPLSVKDLLCLSMTCRALRQATRGLGDPWFYMVAEKHMRRPRTTQEEIQISPSYGFGPDWDIKRFFGIPLKWNMRNLNDGLRLKKTMAHGGRAIYESLRKDVRSASRNWTTQKRIFSEGMDDLECTQANFDRLTDAKVRLRSAIAEMTRYLTNNDISITTFSVPYSDAPADCWRTFANDNHCSVELALSARAKTEQNKLRLAQRLHDRVCDP